MVVLDSSIHEVKLQFSFTNPKAIPPSVRHLDRETFEEFEERQNHPDSVQMIGARERCSLLQFLGELEAAGYEMVDAFSQECANPHNLRGKSTYQMVRFVFLRREFVELSDEFKMIRNAVRAEFRGLCERTTWRGRVFLNPFCKDGERIIGRHTVNISLNMREVILHPDGTPVTMWQRDARGRQVGETPLPLTPNYYLRIIKNALTLVHKNEVV